MLELTLALATLSGALLFWIAGICGGWRFLYDARPPAGVAPAGVSASDGVTVRGQGEVVDAVTGVQAHLKRVVFRVERDVVRRFEVCGQGIGQGGLLHLV